jgi:hypothetical protein
MDPRFRWKYPASTVLMMPGREGVVYIAYKKFDLIISGVMFGMDLAGIEPEAFCTESRALYLHHKPTDYNFSFPVMQLHCWKLYNEDL